MTNDDMIKVIYDDMQQMKTQINEISADMQNVKVDLKEVKLQQVKDTTELKAMDSMILNEVERVHEIMLRRTDDLKQKIG